MVECLLLLTSGRSIHRYRHKVTVKQYRLYFYYSLRASFPVIENEVGPAGSQTLVASVFAMQLVTTEQNAFSASPSHTIGAFKNSIRRAEAGREPTSLPSAPPKQAIKASDKEFSTGWQALKRS